MYDISRGLSGCSGLDVATGAWSPIRIALVSPADFNAAYTPCSTSLITACHQAATDRKAGQITSLLLRLPALRLGPLGRGVIVRRSAARAEKQVERVVRVCGSSLPSPLHA